VLGAIRHFDQRGFGAAPAPQPQPHLVRSYFPQPAFHAATALAPLEAVTTPAPARCKVQPLCLFVVFTETELTRPCYEYGAAS